MNRGNSSCPSTFGTVFSMRDSSCPGCPTMSRSLRAHRRSCLANEDSAAVQLDLAPRLSGFRSSDDEIATATEFERSRAAQDYRMLRSISWTGSGFVSNCWTTPIGCGYRNTIVRESDLRPHSQVMQTRRRGKLVSPLGTWRIWSGSKMPSPGCCAKHSTRCLSSAQRTMGNDSPPISAAHRGRPKPGGIGENAGYTIRVPNDGTHDDFIAELERFLATGQPLRDPSKAGAAAPALI